MTDTAVRTDARGPVETPTTTEDDSRPAAASQTGDTSSADSSPAMKAVEVALIAGLALAASTPYARYFSDAGYLLWVAAGIGLAVAAVGLTQLRAWSVLSTVANAGLGVGALVAFGLYAGTNRHGPPVIGAVRLAVTGLEHGWSRMLSVALPADATADLVVTPVVVAAAAATLGALLVVRTSRLLPPLVGPLLAYVVALLLTAASSHQGLVGAAAFVALSLLFVLVRASREATSENEGISQQAAEAVGIDLTARRLHSTVGRAAYGLPVVAVVAAAAVAGAAFGPIADGSHRLDPRKWRQPPVDVHEVLSPLANLKSTMQASRVALFTVRLSGPVTASERLRLTALDDFDGALWRSPDRFVRTGHELPVDPTGGPPPGSRRVTQTVTLSGLPGPFLPAMGRPVQMQASDFGFDPRSGVLATPQRKLRSYRYVVTSVVPPAGRQLTHGAPAKAEGHDLDLPSRPAWLGQVVADATTGAVTPLDQLKSVEKWLRTLPYDVSSPPGESLGVLQRVLTTTSGFRPGSFEEQRAAAFAVMARWIGFPSRVAVGYVVPIGQGPATAHDVTNRNVSAWPEVDVKGVGWVWFDPTNRGQRENANPPPKSDTGGPGANRTQNNTGPDTSLPSVILSDTNKAKDALHRGPLAIAAVALGAVLAVLALALLGIAIAKNVRRSRRRHAGSAAALVVNAWRETTDRLRERGSRPHAWQTPHEIAAAAATSYGPEAGAPLLALGSLVTRALFDADPPSRAAAEESWQLEATARRSLSRGVGPWHRLLAAVDPRGLLPHRAPGAAPRRRRRIALAGRGAAAHAPEAQHG